MKIDMGVLSPNPSKDKYLEFLEETLPDNDTLEHQQKERRRVLSDPDLFADMPNS